uniref:Uncharacterized protein n=1 Tax=Globodera rostochiensis TaxID=31243 RepID=A0A914H376_GLORO
MEGHDNPNFEFTIAQGVAHWSIHQYHNKLRIKWLTVETHDEGAQQPGERRRWLLPAEGRPLGTDEAQYSDAEVAVLFEVLEEDAAVVKDAMRSAENLDKQRMPALSRSRRDRTSGGVEDEDATGLLLIVDVV